MSRGQDVPGAAVANFQSIPICILPFIPYESSGSGHDQSHFTEEENSRATLAVSGPASDRARASDLRPGAVPFKQSFGNLLSSESKSSRIFLFDSSFISKPRTPDSFPTYQIILSLSSSTFAIKPFLITQSEGQTPSNNHIISPVVWVCQQGLMRRETRTEMCPQRLTPTKTLSKGVNSSVTQDAEKPG